MTANLLDGLITSLMPMNLLSIVGGTFFGIVVGALPGLSAPMATALLAPLFVVLPIIPSFLFVMGLYCGGVYGGSITAILFNTPGTGAAVATCFDGYPLRKQGKAGVALGTAIFCSATGGLLSTIVLILAAPIVLRFALEIGPSEYFALIFLGLSVVGGLISESPLKGILGALIGLFLATVGIDPISGQGRFDFGSPYLLSGFPYIPCLVGLFAVGECLSKMESPEMLQETEEEKKMKKRAELPSWQEIKRLIPTIIKSFGIGTFIGALPGAGAAISAFLAYAEAVRSSKHPEKFGTGVLEGIAAPETANNASCGGAMIPTFTLGIPGSSEMAVLLVIMITRGLQPGPLMFKEQSLLVYTLFMGMFIANLFVFIGGFIMVRVFVKFLLVPGEILYPGILIVAMVGTFSLRSNIGDSATALLIGLLGYFMKKYRWPLGPLALAIVLGPLAENSFRTALVMYENDFTIFVRRPVTAIILFFSIFSLVYPLLRDYRAKKKKQREASKEV